MAASESCAAFAPTFLIYCILRFLAGISSSGLTTNGTLLSKSKLLMDSFQVLVLTWMSFPAYWKSRFVFFSFSDWMDKTWIPSHDNNTVSVCCRDWAGDISRPGFYCSKLAPPPTDDVSTNVFLTCALKVRISFLFCLTESWDDNAHGTRTKEKHLPLVCTRQYMLLFVLCATRTSRTLRWTKKTQLNFNSRSQVFL